MGHGLPIMGRPFWRSYRSPSMGRLTGRHIWGQEGADGDYGRQKGSGAFQGRALCEI